MTEQAQWTSKVKASLEEDMCLFSRVTESPIYKFIGLKLLDKYTHESQLGSDQRKMLKLGSLVNYGDLTFGLEAFGWTLEYGCQLTCLTVPQLSDHQTLSEAVQCNANKNVLVSHAPINEFMLGMLTIDLDSDAFIQPQQTVSKICESKDLVKIRMDKQELNTLVKISAFVQSSQSLMVIECPDMRAMQFANLPSEVITNYRFVHNDTKSVPSLPTLLRSWDIKGIANPELSLPQNDETDRIRNFLADALRQYYLETGVAWHDGLQFECLNQPIFAADSTQSIRALSSIYSISRFGKSLNVVYLPLYEYNNQELLGSYRAEEYQKRTPERKKVEVVSQEVWHPGILERLFNDIERYVTTERTDMCYLSNYHCELSGKQIEK